MGNTHCCADGDVIADQDVTKDKPKGEVGEKKPDVGESPAIVGEPDEPAQPVLASSQTMEQIKRGVEQDINGKAGEEDGGDSADYQFDQHRKAKFAIYVTSLDNKKLENFLLRFEFATEPMDKNKVELLFHALICLYLRKVEKKENLPKDDATRAFCEELSGELFRHYNQKPQIKAFAMTKWIERRELLGLYRGKN